MFRSLVVLVVLICPLMAHATVGGHEYILYPHLNFEIVTNKCQRTETAVLRYSGLMEMLDTHIAHRIAEGQLEDKPFEIIYKDRHISGMGPITELSQNQDGYHILLRHEPSLSLPHLVRLVDYFASESWRPFFGYPRLRDEEEAEKLRSLLDRTVGPPDLAHLEGRRSIVHETGDLRVIFEDGQLAYWLAGEKLELEPGDPPPVQVGNRYLLGGKNHVFVYENGVEIQAYPKPENSWDWGCDVAILAETHGDWVHIGCRGEARLLYSFDYDRFAEVELALAGLRSQCAGDDGTWKPVHPRARGVWVGGQ